MTLSPATAINPAKEPFSSAEALYSHNQSSTRYDYEVAEIDMSRPRRGIATLAQRQKLNFIEEFVETFLDQSALDTTLSDLESNSAWRNEEDMNTTGIQDNSCEFSFSEDITPPISTSAREKYTQFTALIDEMKKQPHSPKKQPHVNTLCDALQDAATTFFHENYSEPGYSEFKQTCYQAINQAKLHLTDKSWTNFFLKLMVTIATFGGAPIVSKLCTGSFYGFFLNKTEKNLNTISEEIPRLAPELENCSL